jgi:hypothetical protein
MLVFRSIVGVFLLALISCTRQIADVNTSSDVTVANVSGSDGGGWSCARVIGNDNFSVEHLYQTDDKGLIGVTRAGRVFRTSRKLTGWQDIGRIPNGFDVDRAFFLANGKGWIVASRGSITATELIGNYVFKTADNGKFWNKSIQLDEAEISDLRFIDESTGWIVGVDHRNTHALLMSTVDGGKTWKDQSSKLKGFAWADSIIFADATSIVLTGRSDRMVLARLFVTDGKTQIEADLSNDPGHGIRGGGTVGEGFWFYGSRESREGLSSTVGATTTTGLDQYTVPGWIDSAVFISAKELITSGFDREDGVNIPFLNYSNDGGRSMHKICSEGSLPEISSLVEIDKNRLIGAASGTLIEVRR